MAYVKTRNTRERILAAAAGLFAKLGFSGVSTRDIARQAGVNEITVYRHYANKQELFMAAVESEVQKLRIRPELVAQLVNAADVHSSLRGVCHLMGDLLAQQPNLARLLQFGALEFGGALIPVCRQYLGSILDLSIDYLKRWTETGELAGELQRHDSRVLILSCVATVVSLPTFYPAIWGETLPLPAGQSLLEYSAGVWYRVLGGMSEAKISGGMRADG